MTKRTRLFATAAAGLTALLLAGCQGLTGAQPRFVQQPRPRLSTPDQRRTPMVVLQSVTRTVTETAPISYPIRTVDDPRMEVGERHVQTPGVPGLRTLTYLVTLTGGRPTSRKLVGSAVTKKPVALVIAVGTRTPGGQRDSCNANYSGCVPVAIDVDCAGGGNGPVYLRHPVKVLGIDIYHLDLDNDGRACAGPDDIP